jgi:putative transcriptional regulator
VRGYLVAALLLFAGATSVALAQASANGVLLVARPTLKDGLFGRSVVLITQPAASDASGPVGVIINKPTQTPVAKLLPNHPHIVGLALNVYIGGPVARQRLNFLVRAPDAPPNAMRLLDDLFLTGDADWVEAALAADAGLQVRVYAGYSSWAVGQLQNELEREGWYIVPAETDMVFAVDGAQLWQHLLQRAMLRTTRANGMDGGTPVPAASVNAAGLAPLGEMR